MLAPEFIVAGIVFLILSAGGLISFLQARFPGRKLITIFGFLSIVAFALISAAYNYDAQLDEGTRGYPLIMISVWNFSLVILLAGIGHLVGGLLAKRFIRQPEVANPSVFD